jgi:hypothetical protein
MIASITFLLLLWCRAAGVLMAVCKRFVELSKSYGRASFHRFVTQRVAIRGYSVLVNLPGVVSQRILCSYCGFRIVGVLLPG